VNIPSYCINKLFQKKTASVSVLTCNDLKAEIVTNTEEFVMPGMSDIFGNMHSLFSGYEVIIPGFYIYTIAEGRCHVGREEVFTRRNQVIEEITSQKKNPCIGSPPVFKRPKRINGNVVNLSLSGLESNYGHYLVELLARVYLLSLSSVHVDYYIISTKFKFQKEFLSLLGIEEKSIIQYYEKEYITANNLIVPSLINNWEDIKYRSYQYYQKQWLPSWLNCLHLGFNAVGSFDHKRLFVSRRKNIRRHIVNEKELYPVLQQNNFHIVDTEFLTVKQQIALFSNAEIIVGPLGAAMSNICFCRNKVKVLEIFPVSFHDSHLRVLTIALGHHYNYMITNSEIDHIITPQEENIFVDKHYFSRALEILMKS